MIELTEEQRLQLAGGKAVDVADTETSQNYVILKKDVYERARQFLGAGSEWSEDDLLFMLARSAKDNGWDEPGMDVYDRYDEAFKNRCL